MVGECVLPNISRIMFSGRFSCVTSLCAAQDAILVLAQRRRLRWASTSMETRVCTVVGGSGVQASAYLTVAIRIFFTYHLAPVWLVEWLLL